MTPTFTATNDHAKAMIRLRENAGLTITTMPACPPASSDLVRPSRDGFDLPDYALPAHIIAALGGVS